MITRPFRSVRRLALLGAAAAGIGAAACGNLTGIPATLATIADSGTVYAINGAPPGAPNALYIFGGSLVTADANFLFDIAFDLDSAGNIVIRPLSTVASGLATAHTVGLRTDTASFDQLIRAPGSGYRADTAIAVRPNTLVIVQSQDPTACGSSITGSTLYAKLVVTSVDVPDRKMVVHYVTDPNCGFRSFQPGVPKD